MKKEIAEAWVKDLREHPNTQTTGRLYDGQQGYCCLGRLCLVMGKEFVYDDKSGKYVVRDTTSYGILATKVAKEAGMRDESGKLPPEAHIANPKKDYDEKLTTLAELNDTGGYTFAQIADVIEKHWEQL